jgi:CDP-glucose 4,6-dehydratase
MLINNAFWKKRRVLLTGHTGFKGSWIALLLERLEAEVTGVSLPPQTNPNHYEIVKPWTNMTSIFCDIRDHKRLLEIVKTADPEIVIHMAAQPLVIESYHSPVDTIETNVMGTIYLLEALKSISNLLAALVITSDKVYANNNSGIPMTETSPLGGYDPYSASKAATEILTSAYSQSFFTSHQIPVYTARAGNVIGGGDWAKNRIIPDLWRAYVNDQPVELRHPEAVRPWQHVLDPLLGYLLYIENMVSNPHNIPQALNFGPSYETIRTVLNVAERFSKSLGAQNLWTIKKSDEYLKESKLLTIDSSLSKDSLGWQSMLNVDTAIDWTCDWYKAFGNGENMRRFSSKQIDAFLKLL